MRKFKGPKASSRIRQACLEALEHRQLLSVTLNNGLATSSPDYFSVVVDNGGDTRNTSFGATASAVGTIYDYFGYLDVGSSAFRLGTYGSAPVTGSDGIARSSGTIPVTGGSIAFSVESSIPSGSKNFINKFSFTATGFDLKNAKFFQYMDADIQSVGDDVLKVQGTTNGTGSGKLILTTIDPATDIRQAQSNGSVAVNSALTGWGADEFATLRTNISTGVYDAANGGTIDTTSLPPTTVTGLGAVYGPNDITTALEYSFTSATSATLSTVLGIDTQIAVAPEIDVTGAGNSILSGDLAPTTTDGTDFGSSPVGTGVSNTFTIRNIGTTSLSITGTPRVQITGANAGDFTVTTLPGNSIAAGGSSNFIIQFKPSATGLRKATVTILSNDDNEGTYSFSIQGTGAAVANRPPTANAGGPYSINEGSGVTLNASGSSDPDGNALTYSWDVNGDGTFGDATGVSPNLTWAQLKALGITDGNASSNYAVKVRVSDGVANTTSSSATLTVKNVAPTANAGADKSTTVGTPVNLSGNQTDPGDADTFTYQWVVTNSSGTQVATSSSKSFNFTPTATGVYTASFKVTDDDGGASVIDTAKITVTTGQLPPTANAGGPYTINEGSGLSLNASGSSDPNGDPLTYSWDINGDGNFGDATGVSPNLTWAQLKVLGITDGNATSVYAVKVKVSDGIASIDSSAGVLTVKNVAPSANAGADKSTVVNTGVSLSGASTDPGDSDVLTYSWIVKDSSNNTVATSNAKSFVFTPTVAGTYTATFKASDDDGGSNTDSAIITVRPEQTTGPKFTKFVLVNADTDRDIIELDFTGNTTVLNLATLPRRLNVRVEGESGIKSVRIFLDGRSIGSELAKPWSLFSDLNGDYRPGTFRVGTRSFVVQGFGDFTGAGTVVATTNFTFNVINAVPTATTKVTAFELFNTATGQVIRQLSMYDTINLALLPSTIGIRAVTTGNPTSVEYHVDAQVKPASAALSVGRHQITAVPSANGVTGDSFFLVLFVVNQPL